MYNVAGHGTRTVVHPPRDETSPDNSEHYGGSTGIPEWLQSDWDDYDIQAGSSARGGARGDGADPIATMLDGVPGFIAEDIAALLRDLPLPAAGDVAGMTVEEAIQVLHTIC